jgi:hypothetical protein
LLEFHKIIATIDKFNWMKSIKFAGFSLVFRRHLLDGKLVRGIRKKSVGGVSRQNRYNGIVTTGILIQVLQHQTGVPAEVNALALNTQGDML